MKIAVVAANGRVAGKVITEAVNRGFDVTAYGRQDNNTVTLPQREPLYEHDGHGA